MSNNRSALKTTLRLRPRAFQAVLSSDCPHYDHIVECSTSILCGPTRMTYPYVIVRGNRETRWTTRRRAQPSSTGRATRKSLCPSGQFTPVQGYLLVQSRCFSTRTRLWIKSEIAKRRGINLKTYHWMIYMIGHFGDTSL